MRRGKKRRSDERTGAVVCLVAGGLVGVLWDLIASSKVFTSPLKVLSLSTDTAFLTATQSETGTGYKQDRSNMKFMCCFRWLIYRTTILMSYHTTTGNRICETFHQIRIQNKCLKTLKGSLADTV